MIARHCIKAPLTFINTTKRIGVNTLRCLDGLRNNYRSNGELSNATWSIASIGASVLNRKTCYQSFSRGKSTGARDTKPVVIHDPVGKLFYIDGNEKGRAVLDYEQKDRVIKILHTEVPKAFAGLGYAKLLAKDALEFTARNDYHLEVYCGFVNDYITKYAPQYLKNMKKLSS